MTVPASQSDTLASIRGWAPAELVSFLDQILILFPEELKYRLKVVLDALPPEGDNMHKVLELVQSQWTSIQSQEWTQIAVVGPSRTGKATLVRAITGRQAALSKPMFVIVDIPGLEEYLGYRAGGTLPDELREASVLLLVLDARYELTDSTVQIYEKMRSLNRAVLVVLNKIDVVDHPREVLRKARRKLDTNLFGVSAVDPESINKLLKAVVAANPKTLYPLTQNFPGFRRTICHSIVTQSAFAAAVVGAIPIPVSDLLPITAIQTAMLLKIARAFGYRLNRERARELLPMLAAGAAVREGSHRLRRRFPGYADLIAVSVAGAWTFVLGQGALRYFERFSNFLQVGEWGEGAA